MPTIVLIEKKKREFRPKINQNKRDNLNHRFVYNTTKWRELRLFYLSKQPLCEICLEKDIIKCAVDVHHIIPIDSVNDIKGKIKLGFDETNLKSLCKDCHKEVHKH